MRTKNEVFDRLMQILDFVIAVGFFDDDEVKEIEELEREYYITSEGETEE